MKFKGLSDELKKAVLTIKEECDKRNTCRVCPFVKYIRAAGRSRKEIHGTGGGGE